VRVDVGSGWIEGAERVPSPNCDERPEGSRPELVVVHAISLPPGEFGGPWIDHLFTNRLDPEAHPYFREIADLEVSAHLLIRRDGRLVQYVPFHRRAWHAGASSWQGRERCNDFSIGIELEGCDDLPFEDVQYERLAAVIGALRQAYPSIAPDAVAGHSDIAPGRKTDPGPQFRWSRLWAALGDSGPGIA
jgi:N-acetyl-anhydromuramoyl-L-alanine amidase